MTSTSIRVRTKFYGSFFLNHVEMGKVILALIVSWLVPGAVAGQVISTVAGTTWSFPASVTKAVDAPLGTVSAIAADSQGNIYVGTRSTARSFGSSPTGPYASWPATGRKDSRATAARPQPHRYCRLRVSPWIPKVIFSLPTPATIGSAR